MKEFDRFLRLIYTLREKCPWDKVQTIQNLKSDLLSEVYEVVDAIRNEDYDNLREEIGDLIWILGLITQVAKEEGFFDMATVLNDVNEKMIRRHPHVFGTMKAKSAEDARRIFYQVKDNE
jgi:uncharacterized protein YabN with tetrapyrrole methylase and pyrophosphatase domain